jgi:SnoaL-like protein
MSEQNKAVVRRVFEDHCNARNPALASELFAPSVSLHTPDGVLTVLDGASLLLQAYGTAFPDFHLTIDDLITDGQSGCSMDVHRNTPRSARRRSGQRH